MAKRSSFQGTKINPSRFHRSQIKFYCFLIPIAMLFVFPLFMTFNNAFKPVDEANRFPPTIVVERPTLDNFRFFWGLTGQVGVPASRFLVNTIMVTAVTIFFTVIITAMTGYCFSKKKFRLNNVMWTINRAAILFIPVAVEIPRYIIIMNMGIENTFWAHIIPGLATPVGLFMVKQFIDQIPDSLIEAARIDGAGELRIMWNIVFPLIQPALATIVVLTFQGACGATEASNRFVDSETLRTFAFFMGNIPTGGNPVYANVGAALTIVMLVPNLIIFLFLQSKVMNTMAHSGIK